MVLLLGFVNGSTGSASCNSVVTELTILAARNPTGHQFSISRTRDDGMPAIVSSICTSRWAAERSVCTVRSGGRGWWPYAGWDVHVIRVQAVPVLTSTRRTPRPYKPWGRVETFRRTNDKLIIANADAS